MLLYKPRETPREYFARPEGMSPVLHALLLSRGVRSQEEAQKFLHPAQDDLHDPMRLHDMGKAVKRLRKAVEAGEQICVYGDYDVDGVCASAILFLHLQALGARVDCYIPSRHTEGYGLNEPAVRKISETAQLLLTVDCGINSVALVELAAQLGMDVIITDHHRPGEILPACPVINPLLGEYPSPVLCGAGVAFKLVEALSSRESAMAYIDLAALATVADVVPLVDENRAIVKIGLEKINESPRLGIAKLIESAKLTGRAVSAGSIGFQIGPRINAGGRMGSARRAFDLLTGTDDAKACALALELEEENAQRRVVEQKILDEAEQMLASFDFPAHRAIVLKGEDWNPGVLGLAAARLVGKYYYPTILLAEMDGALVGSCRSIEGVDIFSALKAVDHCLLRYGGHKQAAGLSLAPEKFAQLQAALDRYLWENTAPQTYIPTLTYDLQVTLDELDAMTVASLEQLQPTGMGNPQPVLRALAQASAPRRVGREGAHLKLTLFGDSREIGGVFFGRGDLADSATGRCDILFSPKINAYMGNLRVEAEMRALNPVAARERFAAERGAQEERVLRFLTEMLYNTSSPVEAPESDASAIQQAILAGPQGTLLVAWDEASALWLLDRIAPETLDIYFGKYPDDPRAFNALCVLPVGAMPPNYRRVLRVCGVPAWFCALPDVSTLREIYKALLRISMRPHVFSGFSGLVTSLMEEAGVGKIGCAAGILALNDLDLVSLRLDGAHTTYAMRPGRKVNPETSAVFQKITSWRELACARKGGEP